MIRRLFMLLLVSIIVVGGSASFRPVQSASSDPCKQDHAAWLTQVLGKMSTIKPGMTRWDVLHVFRAEEGAPRLFRTEGGPETGLRETFVSQDCPYFKIDVEFKPWSFDLHNQDVIVNEALCAIRRYELDAQQAAQNQVEVALGNTILLFLVPQVQEEFCRSRPPLPFVPI